MSLKAMIAMTARCFVWQDDYIETTEDPVKLIRMQESV